MKTIHALRARGLVKAKDSDALEAVAERFSVSVTPAVVRAIDAADDPTPLSRQFVPSAAELAASPESLRDPIGDDAHSPVNGVVHRYKDRVLLNLLRTCAVYCRYCFRREAIGPGQGALSKAEIDAALDYIRADSRIWEVILSGGDPLILKPGKLAEIVGRIGAIPHVGVVRFHTRVPTVAPERIDDTLIAAIKAGPTAYVALHVNHAAELTPEALAAIGRMADAGIPLLSQSVLLKGVNDDATTLETLFRTLVRHRVKPYYLHQLDYAEGVEHFRVSIEDGQALMSALRGDISGLCQPTYVLDIPGGHGKIPLTPSSLFAGEGGVEIRDRNGALHPYPPKRPNPEAPDR